jgi:hypothetical protein
MVTTGMGNMLPRLDLRLPADRDFLSVYIIVGE